MKCVEELKKKYKELNQENKLDEVELKHLENNEEKAAVLLEELDRAKEKLELGKQEVEDIDNKVIS